VIGGLPTVVSLGRLLTRRGALAAAEDLLEGARQQLYALELRPPQLAPLFQVLADIAEQRGDSAAAIAHLREVIRLKEQAARDEVRRERAQLELRAEMKATRQEAEIHRLKYVELTEMQTQLVEAEKMAQLGSLAAGTAHELNTPLGVLRSNLDLQARALERLAQISIDNAASHAQIVRLQQALAACTRTSEDALARIATVAESFKLFTQLDLADRRVFNVVEGLRSAIALLRPNLPARITLDSQFEPVPDIAGWPGQLNQAFMTVLLNATQAIDGQGSVTVETSAAQSGVVVRVRDTGRGMTEAERTQLFDVGWSSGGTRLRMRLGLSAAYATVLRHRGRVDVQTAPGQGTSFVLSFPAHDGA
jgi:signal transduction histidine kinase